MKHLKKFDKFYESSENFDSFDDLEQDCIDILREAEDDGYDARFKLYKATTNYDTYIEIFIQKMGVLNPDEFWNGIKEVSERLEYYLMDNGFGIEWQSPKEKAEKRPTVQISKIKNPMNFEDVNMKTHCRFLYKPINR